jgi:hypothetical protein
LRLLGPPLEALGCQIASLEFLLWDGSLETAIDWYNPEERVDAMSEPRILRAYVAGDTVAQLIRGARQANALLAAATDRPIDASSAARLILGGMLESIVGLPESEWLEVKSRAYDLNAPTSRASREKLELAQDIARFANGEVSAVLVVGYRTERNSSGGEVIEKVTAVKRAGADFEQHRKVIDSHIYPTVEGLRIERVLVEDDRAVLVIEIPRQPEHLKPFLVHGAVVGDRVDRAFISIVRRRDSHSVVTDPSQIHAQIAAGRALLRDGRAPKV